jgi:hypothetical protein
MNYLVPTAVTKGFSLFVAALLLTASIAYAEARFRTVVPEKKTCSGSKACLTENNTGSGSAILGMSLSGTTIEANATTGTAIYGSSTGTASATVGTNASTGTGVYGYSKSGYGVSGESHANVAVDGYSALSDGVYGQTSGDSPAAGVYGYMSNASSNGTGVVGESFGTGILAQADGDAGTALVVNGGTSFEGEYNVIRAQNSDGDGVLTFDDSGNLEISGLLYTSGQCINGCSKTRHIVSYAAQATLPTLDDVGEATLQFGRAHVRFDADFANAIDAPRRYLVLLTPEGDSRGLYVARKWSSGFEVRENEGGRSSISFAYRIVAQPYGKVRQRLPFVESPAPLSRIRHR